MLWLCERVCECVCVRVCVCERVCPAPSQDRRDICTCIDMHFADTQSRHCVSGFTKAIQMSSWMQMQLILPKINLIFTSPRQVPA